MTEKAATRCGKDAKKLLDILCLSTTRTSRNQKENQPPRHKDTKDFYGQQDKGQGRTRTRGQAKNLPNILEIILKNGGLFTWHLIHLLGLEKLYFVSLNP
jgi:hypothetical protein